MQFHRKMPLIFLVLIPIVSAKSYEPLSKEEQLLQMNKLNSDVEPFRQNLTNCAREVRASMEDVENFMKRIPQRSPEGKCFVACILKRYNIIVKNKISKNNLMEANMNVYGRDSDIVERLHEAFDECQILISDIFEICEYASTFNDCMHMKMEHILDRAIMDQRMEALGQMSSQTEEPMTDDEDDLLKLINDEL